MFQWSAVRVCCRLIAADASSRKIKLIIYVERGSMYHQLKQQHDGVWIEMCQDILHICSQTAVNRYISVYEFAAQFPLIIICDLAFETIMRYKSHERIGE